MRKRACLVLLLALAGCDDKQLPPPQPALSASALAPGPKVHERVILSPVYEVDQIYKSMQGPHDTQAVDLAKLEQPELLWIVGFEAVMVSKDGEDSVSQEFMCHANLDMDPVGHRDLFGHDKQVTGRLFTLSQGQYRIDMPKGYGIPVSSAEALTLNTQVLNLNMKDGKREVRHRVIMRYLRDSELSQPMKPLYVAGAFGLKLLEGQDGVHGMDPPADKGGDPHAGHHDKGAVDHAACLPGQNAGANTFDDGKGRTFTGHWVVPPGREVNHTRVTKLMDLPADTTLHYVAVHLHPYAETLELKDVTAGTTVYKAKTRQADEGIGLAHVDFFSSEAGVPLYKDHEYEIISTYNNTSSEPQDSMAVMNLYLVDKEFKKPDLTKPVPAAPSAAPSVDGAGPTAPSSTAKPAAGKLM